MGVGRQMMAPGRGLKEGGERGKRLGEGIGRNEPYNA